MTNLPNKASPTKANGEKILEDNKSIPSSEVRQDISDTQDEIFQMEREIKGYELIGDKMSLFKAENRKIGIRERLEFIEKLNNLLRLRGDL